MDLGLITRLMAELVVYQSLLKLPMWNLDSSMMKLWTWGYGAGFDNVVIAQADPSIAGYVLNGGGQTIAGATIEILENGRTATTGPTGEYTFYGVLDGTYTLEATKTGYNPATAGITITGGVPVAQDFILTAPNITVTPLIFDETLHPNEYMTTYLSLLNTGDGALNWAAGIIYPMVPPLASSSVNIPAFNAEKGAPQSDVSAALAPATGLQGTPSQQGSGLRGAIAFGYEAISNVLMDFDVDAFASHTSFSATPAPPNFINGMAFPRNETDFAYAVVYGSSNLYMIDRASGALTDLGALSGSTPSAFNDITVDVTSGILYGTGDDNLYAIDPVGMTSTFLGGHVNSSVMIGIACDVDGDLWGYDIGFDWFYSIDKFTGLATDVGSIGFNASFAQSMLYDETTDNIILAAFNAGNFYTEIRVADRTTGATTILSSSYYEEATGAALPVSSGGGGAEGWLTLSDYSGFVAPGGGTFNIGVNFDASGTVAGEVYTADIVVSTNPFVGEITVPVTMTIGGDPFPVISGFTAELTDAVTGEVTLMWNSFREPTLDYYIIYRNGAPLTTTDNSTYVDMLPGFGTYDYELQPVFLEGNGVMVGPETVEWYEPELCWDDYAENEQWTDQMQEVTIELENCASEGVLYFEFPDYVGGNSPTECSYQFEGFDSFGDGWNGASLDIFVDGVFVVSATVTGSGPSYFDIPVTNGAVITGTWNSGTWDGECSYYIYDCGGAQVYSSGAGGITPPIVAEVPVFIASVVPESGTLEAGETVDVVLTYSSFGFEEGDYYQELFILTNEPDAPPASREQIHTVDNWMYVVEPTTISGTVTDCNTGQPIGNAMVTAYVDTKDLDDTFMTETAEDGTYMLYVNPDEDYDVMAENLGYQAQMQYC